jgi:hypothetical protein
MGLFKQMKDMKETLHEAPAMVANAQALGAQAQQYAAAQQAAAQGYAGGSSAAVDEPPAINGIDLATYARVSKVIANAGVGADGVPAVVSAQGIAPEDWTAAVEGWNARFKGNMGLATRYGTLYTEA